MVAVLTSAIVPPDVHGSIANRLVMRPTLFLDRDGVINVDMHYLHTIEAFEWMPGIIPLMQYMQAQDYRIIVCTNQSGIGRGYYSEQDFVCLTQWMCQQLQQHQVYIEAVYYCPHDSSEACNCRKPLAGMFEAALASYPTDIQASCMIGDKISDIQAANAVAVPCNVLLSSEYTTAHVTTELRQAAPLVYTQVDNLHDALAHLQAFVHQHNHN